MLNTTGHDGPVSYIGNDFAAVHGLLEAALCPFYEPRVRRRDAASDIRNVPLPDLNLVSIYHGDATYLSADPMEDKVLLALPMNKSLEVSIGKSQPIQTVKRGSCLLLGPADHYQMVLPAKTRLLVMRWDYNAGAAAGARTKGPFSCTMPQDVGAILPFHSDAAFTFQRLAQFIFSEASTNAALWQRSTNRAHFSAILEDAWSDAVTSMAEPSLPGHAAGPRPYYVKRAEDFILKDLSVTPSVAQLVEQSGVSRRTLFRGFKEHWGLSPLQFARQCRFERVHQDLIARSPNNTRVIDVAYEWGFYHLGQFARDYKLRFGQSPSQTLLKS